MSSLKHENITPLLGICVEDNELISVYDFLSGGNLEENLHGNSKETSVLSWELRFKPAVEIVEALNYLRNECSGPVIHRDFLSSECNNTPLSLAMRLRGAPSQGRVADPNIMKYTLKVFPVSVFEA
ncbi:hypothetical protein CsSME_00023291 [Camellia sinensis var. sinensis]